MNRIQFYETLLEFLDKLPDDVDLTWSGRDWGPEKQSYYLEVKIGILMKESLI